MEEENSLVQAAIKPPRMRIKRIPSAKSRTRRLKQKLYRRMHRSLIRRQQREWRRRNPNKLRLQRLRRKKK